MPTVSVIMTVYNGERYLRAAIDSVLAQNGPIEFIVVNDGSQDGSEAIIQQYGTKIQYFFQPNQGQPTAQNQGIRLAKGRYITFLDADDLHHAEKTPMQVAYLEAHPEVDMVFGQVEQFISPELPLETKGKWHCPPGSAPGYLAAAGLFRRECFERVGLFNEKQRIGLFIEWYMRSCDGGLKSAVTADPVLKRRIHENNMGIREKNARFEYLQIVKSALARRSHAK